MTPDPERVAAQSFDLGDVLSVTTGRLVSPRHMDGIYDVLNFLTGDNLFTHQLPRAGRWAAPKVLERHPDLAVVKVPEIHGEAELQRWLDIVKAQHGVTRMLCRFSGWDVQNQIEELCDMVGPERVYVVAPNGELP